MNSELKFIPANESHYADIIALNEELVHFLAPMDMEKMLELKDFSSLFNVIECEGEMAAFVICIREGTAYDNENYLYFNENYESFLYVDRIVISPNFHRRGIGKFIYSKIFEFTRANAIARLTGEIDIKPENPVSLAFHKNLGFKEVGTKSVYGGKKVVSLQVADIV